MIQGQDKICELIDSATLDSFPRSLMIVGPEGGGKHLICDYIAEKFQLQTVDLTSTLDLETIEELYNRVEPYLYTIMVNEISVKEENVILKFLEEPLKNSFIIPIAETDIGILPNILNRCQVWYLQNYSKEFLVTFLDGADSFILDIATTPGKVLQLRSIDLTSSVELADKILNKIEVASAANTLTLSNKIGFKDDSEHVDVKIFTDLLLARITHHWKYNIDIRWVQAYQLTSKLKQNLCIKNLDQRYLFENYLLALRNIMRGDE